MKPITVNPKQLALLIEHVMFTADLVPMITGSPGIGKSSIVKQIADKHNLELIVFTLSNRDSTDVTGIPTLNADRTRSSIAPPDYFPIEGDPLPEGKDGWIIFFDEIKDAEKLLQASVNQVILERTVGFKKLHTKTWVAAAGNFDTDNGAAEPLTTTMQSRMLHFILDVDLEAWISWGTEKEIDSRVLDYIQAKPDYLHNFDPDHEDVTFSCPRTLEMLSKAIKPLPVLDDSTLPLIVSAIGQTVGLDFKVFVDAMQSLPNIKQIINTPERIVIDREPSTLFAITVLIGHHLNEDNCNQLIKFIRRLPKEFQSLILSNWVKKDLDLLDHPVIDEWTLANGPLFGAA